jgi:hypothetical protein
MAISVEADDDREEQPGRPAQPCVEEVAGAAAQDEPEQEAEDDAADQHPSD